ncbi:hypothetical protein TEA_021874 [Camellia sinensis var. sinensis]|uniref:HECT-type E3 ubiquitin transferase n=1 Tax=Camellia sinensis var. sinensis TaxID=542762 RepID=A0A4S4EDA0_CAMSN|nr:hypothetical protein TEA_021874 [Camellia sinensis var. sinensis]
MFFSGDSSARKRVDLGGRSSKERDRQKLLEQTRLERNRRLWLRQQNSAAIKIQKCFRGRKAVEAERLRVREHFFMTYGKRCQNVDRHSFGLDSDFLRQLLFFFNPQNVADFSALVETCRLLQQFVRESGVSNQSSFLMKPLIVMLKFSSASVQAFFFSALPHTVLLGFIHYSALSSLSLGCVCFILLFRNLFVVFTVFNLAAGGILSLFAGVDYSSKYAVVDYRVKQLAYACIRGVHQNRNLLTRGFSIGRNQLKDQLFMTSDKSSTSTILLLEAVVMLIDPGLPWSCKIVGYLLQRNTYYLLREIVLTGKESIKFQDSVGKISSLESILALIIPHVGQRSCVCANIDPRWSFSSQILTIPFLWKLFPYLKEIFATRELSVHYIHQMALCVQNHANVLPNDIATEFPGYACLLGNLLETAGVAFSQPDCSFDMAIDFAAVATFLLEALPPMQSSNKESKEVDEDEIIVGDEMMEKGLNKDLELQISNAIDPRFLLQLTNVLFGRISFVNGSYEEGAHGKEVVAVGAACAFLHVTFNILPLERVMTVLAYRTELVPVIWKFMKRCHENQMWSALSGQLSYLPGDAPGWLLPLSVFCPVYKHMLMIVDNEEFYEQEKPLSIKDIKCLVVILRQALWQLLWVNPVTPPNPAKCAADVLMKIMSNAWAPLLALWQLLWVNPVTPPNPAKCTADVFTLKRHPLEFIQHRVSIVASDLLSQLQDWNNRRQFTAPSDFHADGVNDHFISQAMIENSRAHEILKHAPFLVPFTSRVKIFTSQLAAARQRHGPHAVFTRNRFRIRRDHILEDAFSQLSALSEEDLRGPIRVTFVNGFGVEEAGIDGGGIFKDFMENITRAAFDVQYGLFKETVDHLLYPNPGSGMIHEQHLQFFHFLGTVLAKHYEGDTSKLELYFVIVNNEYGEQTEEELLPGGKSIRVTNENVITFIHLIANHRLNSQIRQQSSHFLRGFQQLIQKDWIDMFNEHELQLLISGSLDGFDVEDLRAHTNYAGGYHSCSWVEIVVEFYSSAVVNLVSSRFNLGVSSQLNPHLSASFPPKLISCLGQVSASCVTWTRHFGAKTRVRVWNLCRICLFSLKHGSLQTTKEMKEEHYVIDMLWAVLKNFSMENQMKFLKFVTGCSRGPLLGFKYLEPLFCIQRAAGNASEEALDRLPTSATCMNLLKLPPYRSRSHLMGLKAWFGSVWLPLLTLIKSLSMVQQRANGAEIVVRLKRIIVSTEKVPHVMVRSILAGVCSESDHLWTTAEDYQDIGGALAAGVGGQSVVEGCGEVARGHSDDRCRSIRKMVLCSCT